MCSVWGNEGRGGGGSFTQPRGPSMCRVVAGMGVGRFRHRGGWVGGGWGARGGALCGEGVGVWGGGVRSLRGGGGWVGTDPVGGGRGTGRGSQCRTSGRGSAHAPEGGGVC